MGILLRLKSRIGRRLPAGRAESQGLTAHLARIDLRLTEIERNGADGGALRKVPNDIANAREEIRDADVSLRFMVGEVSTLAQAMHGLIMDINHRTHVAERRFEALERSGDRNRDTVAAISEEVRAEREAVFASNEAVLGSATALLKQIEWQSQETVRLISERMEQQSNELADASLRLSEAALFAERRPYLEDVHNLVDRASEVVSIARSQYTDGVPRDASDIAPVLP